MASISLSFSLNTTTATASSQSKPPQRPARFGVWCEIQKDSSSSHMKFDRRNLLLGMGGLYGGANLDSSASATPISSPDLSKCTTGTNLNTSEPLEDSCCPPLSEIVDYKLPPFANMRVRPAAHLVSKEYVAKYERATELMKALPDDDPRSFMQQANVHCAYCNLTYEQAGDSSMRIQIHNSWLFYPWHRWYLYFYERILGKLIDDPTFTLPFWNWDHPDGITMPAMYVKNDSPLYDERRNQDHLPPAVLELNYSARSSQPEADASQIVPNNLVEMYGEMVRNVSNIEDFYGAKYVIGTAPDPGPGSVERGSHSAVHAWVGDPRSPGGENMGNFYTVGRDPCFFAHHTNVDRMWSVWRSLRGSKPKDFTEPDWLDSNFLFYDENKQLVRVTVRDTLEEEKMGFTYQKVDLPWLNRRPQARVRKSKVAATSTAPNAAEETVFPVKLDKVVKVLVDRPKKSRSKKEKEEKEELLVIEGIEVDSGKYSRFEVYVNDEDDKAGELIDKAEYAGCYSQVPHKNSMKVKSKIRLGLTELLEDLDVEDDDKILVSLVPKAKGEDITIGGVKIIYA